MSIKKKKTSLNIYVIALHWLPNQLTHSVRILGDEVMRSAV